MTPPASAHNLYPHFFVFFWKILLQTTTCLNGTTCSSTDKNISGITIDAIFMEVVNKWLHFVAFIIFIMVSFGYQVIIVVMQHMQNPGKSIDRHCISNQINSSIYLPIHMPVRQLYSSHIQNNPKHFLDILYSHVFNFSGSTIYERLGHFVQACLFFNNFINARCKQIEKLYRHTSICQINPWF